MNRGRMFAYVAAARAARALQWAALAIGVFGAIKHGIESLALGAAGFWFFGTAKPPAPPDE